MGKKPVTEAANYDELLNRSWDEIPEPKTLPGGNWLLELRNIAYKGPTDTANAKVLVFLTPKQPSEDVDSSALADLGDEYDVSENQIVHTFWVEHQRDWQAVRNFLTMLGVDMKGKSQIESFKAAKGGEIMGYLDERTYTNSAGQLVTENIVKAFSPLE